MADQGAASPSFEPSGSNAATVEGSEPDHFSDSLLGITEPFPGFMMLLVMSVILGGIWHLISLVPGLRLKARRP